MSKHFAGVVDFKDHGCRPFFDRRKDGKDHRYFSDQRHSSSDGQRIETQIPTINARYSSKYFGLKKGVSAYTLVLNHVPINAKIIATHEHESHLRVRPAAQQHHGYQAGTALDRHAWDQSGQLLDIARVRLSIRTTLSRPPQKARWPDRIHINQTTTPIASSSRGGVAEHPTHYGFARAEGESARIPGVKPPFAVNWSFEPWGEIRETNAGTRPPVRY
jgi:hypothetical protein